VEWTTLSYHAHFYKIYRYLGHGLHACLAWPFADSISKPIQCHSIQGLARNRVVHESPDYNASLFIFLKM